MQFAENTWMQLQMLSGYFIFVMRLISKHLLWYTSPIAKFAMLRIQPSNAVANNADCLNAPNSLNQNLDGPGAKTHFLCETHTPNLQYQGQDLDLRVLDDNTRKQNNTQSYYVNSTTVTRPTDK